MTAPATQSPLHAAFPRRVGKYELLLPIGTGGMATVYLARSAGVGGFERDVALKLVHAHLRADTESRLQLMEEARIAARIRHPNVVPVLEVDEDPFGVYLVMDYVEGPTLSGLVRAFEARGERIPRRIIARLLDDALAGLHAAHELRDSAGQPLGLVHRDFSPQNILISVQGVTRLTDFGVAKAANRAIRTKTGLVKGKISYMSPEQARGRPLDRRCDVWAAGVLAWELLSGEKLHRNEDDVATLLKIVTTEPERLRQRVPDLPQQLDDAVHHALQCDPTERCPDAETLRQAFANAWNIFGGIADHKEVAAIVQKIEGGALATRRQVATQLFQERKSRPSGNAWIQLTADYRTVFVGEPAVTEDRASSVPPLATGEMPQAPEPTAQLPQVTTEQPAAMGPLPEPTQQLPQANLESVTRRSAPSIPVGHLAAQLEEMTQTSAVVPSVPESGGRQPVRRRFLAVALVASIAGGLVWAALYSPSPPGTAAKPEPPPEDKALGAEMPDPITPKPTVEQRTAPKEEAEEPALASPEAVPPPPNERKPREARTTPPVQRKAARPGSRRKNTRDVAPKRRPGLASNPYARPSSDK